MRRELRVGLWRVLDIDWQGRRALIIPRSLPRRGYAALIGQDLQSGEPFFIPVPPWIRSVNEAMDWVYDLPLGTWNNAEADES